jgi:hypothetical protein
MTPWDAVGLTLLVYLAAIGLDVIVVRVLLKFSRRKQPRVQPNVVHLDDWRNRSDPPKSS